MDHFGLFTELFTFYKIKNSLFPYIHVNANVLKKICYRMINEEV